MPRHDGTLPCQQGKRRALPKNPQGRIAEQIAQLEVSVRAKIEGLFHNHDLFGYKKVHYRSLFKNTA